MRTEKEIFDELIRADRDLLGKLPVKTRLKIQAEADSLRWVLESAEK